MQGRCATIFWADQHCRNIGMAVAETSTVQRRAKWASRPLKHSSFARPSGNISLKRSVFTPFIQDWKNRKIPEDLRDYRPVAQFPELTHRDTSVYAAALQQTVVAVGIAVEKGMMTEETAVSVIGSMISRIGIEINPAEELEQARTKARAQIEDDIYDEQDV